VYSTTQLACSHRHEFNACSLSDLSSTADPEVSVCSHRFSIKGRSYPAAAPKQGGRLEGKVRKEFASYGFQKCLRSCIVHKRMSIRVPPIDVDSLDFKVGSCNVVQSWKSFVARCVSTGDHPMLPVYCLKLAISMQTCGCHATLHSCRFTTI
jgi:hypothetical protein